MFKCWFATVGLLLVHNSSFAQEFGSSAFKKAFNEAYEFVESDAFNKAEPILESLHRSDTLNANVNHLLGICYLRGSKQYSKAILRLQQASRDVAAPDTYNEGNWKERKAPGLTYFYLGRAHHALNQFQEAITNYYNYRSFISLDDVETYNQVRQQIQYAENAIELIKEPIDVKVTNLGPRINTKYPDYCPVVSADGRVLIFTSRREGGTGDKKDEAGNYYDDIYVCQKQPGGGWSTPETIGQNINSEGHEAAIGLSPDGQLLFIYKDDNNDGNIYQSKRTTNGWSKPEPLGSDINTSSWETHATVNAAQDLLVFTSNRSEGGYGGRDLWYSKRLPNGEWGLAQNMGSVINTDFEEDSPFISADGNTLIFSSQGHTSMGGFDIFRSEFVDGAWTSPENIGYPISSSEDDVFLTIAPDGRTGYYSSSMDGGFGSADLYSVYLNLVEKTGLAVARGLMKVPAMDYANIEAKIEVTDEVGAKVGTYRPNTSTGFYVLVLTPGETYRITYMVDGYPDVVKEIPVSMDESYQEYEGVLELEEVVFGEDILALQKHTEALEKERAEAAVKAAEEERLAKEALAKAEAAAKARQDSLAIAAEQEKERKKAEELAAKERREAELALEVERQKAQEAEFERKKQEAIAKAKADEEARLKAEQELAAKEAEAAQIRAEEETVAKQAAEEAARLAAEEQARLQAEDELAAKEAEAARIRAEEEKVAKQAAEEAARLAAEEEARLQAEQELAAKEAEAAQILAEQEMVAKQAAEEEARLQAEEASAEGIENVQDKANEQALAETEENAQKAAYEAEMERKRLELQERIEALKSIQKEQEKTADETQVETLAEEQEVKQEIAVDANEIEAKRKAMLARIEELKKRKEKVQEQTVEDEKQVAIAEEKKKEAIAVKEDLEGKAEQTKEETDELEAELEIVEGQVNEAQSKVADAKAEVELAEKKLAEDIAEQNRIAEEEKRKQLEAEQAAKELEELKKAEEKRLEQERLAAEQLEREQREEAERSKRELIQLEALAEQQAQVQAALEIEERKQREMAEADAQYTEQEVLNNASTIEELRKLNQQLIKDNLNLRKQLIVLNAKLDLILQRLDYQPEVERIDIPKSRTLQNLQEGRKMILRNIFFDYNQATLRSRSKHELNKLFDFLKRNGEIEIQVSGHTDSRGDDEYNLRLSKNRAQAVVDYLIRNGIAKSRLKAVGYGETRPIARNENPDGSDNPVGRQLNRRIEISLPEGAIEGVELEKVDVPEDAKLRQ